jgi:predicted  nucleic acid-binding Zn-ribbon protein
MASNKRTIYLGLDYSQFTGGVTEVNRKMQLLDQEFKLAQEQARNYGNASDQLALKEDYLTQKIALQNQKVEEARKAYDAAMSSQNASQKEIDELDKRLLKERTTLEQLNGQLKDAQAKTLGLDEANQKLDKSMKSLAVGAAAAVTALVKFSLDAANTADDLKTLSAQTGMTTTEIQRLQYAANFVDVSFDTMASSITKLESNMDKARNGSKEMTEAFRKLHVRVTDNNGQLKDANDLFMEIVDKLGTVKNETERDALAMQIFGRSAKELNPLIQAGSDELRKLGDEAERTGKIMSEEDVEAGASMSDSMQRLNASVQAVKNGLGQALMPVLQTFADILSSIDPKVLEIVTLGAGAIALVMKLVTAISVLTTAMAAHNGVQMIFNATSLKSIGIILAVVAALAVLGAIIAAIVGKTNDMSKAMDDAAKMSQNVSKNINQSMNNTYSTGRNASGTDNWQGGQTWVGEEGPELVTLPRGSKITPADQAGGRSEVNNYYITIDAKNVQDFNRVVELAQQQKMALRRV